MSLTITELQEKLKQVDEISLMEILEITSEDLANRFIDRIESKYDQLITEFEEYETTDELDFQDLDDYWADVEGTPFEE